MEELWNPIVDTAKGVFLQSQSVLALLKTLHLWKLLKTNISTFTVDILIKT